ncbi:MAG TPA: hypothetical protein VN645_04065 [Steroidobacteraceae bacterium]|nr:hypothetical protein [Steroidobacteraceae bacterium]
MSRWVRDANHTRSARLLAVFLLTLSACGGGGDSGGSGGGGGGGSGGGGSLRVALTTNSLSWNYFLTATPTAQAAGASVTGTYDGTVYAGAVVENDGATNAINPNITLSINATTATAVVAPVANLPVGTYTGRILFLACSDNACNNRIGGTPLTVPFTITVKRPVQSTPNPLSVTAVSGSPLSQAVTVQPGEGENAFGSIINSAFIHMANISGTGFTLNLPSLPVGTHTGTIDFTGNLGSRGSLTVNYTVQAPPGGEHGIAVSPSGLTFSTIEGASSAPQSITVDEPTWKPGLKTPVVTYNGGANGWLQVTPVPGGYSVVATAASLSAGTYQATVDIEANPLPAGIIDPLNLYEFRRVNVSLTVGAGLVRPADVHHIVTGDSTAGSLTGTVAVNVAGGSAVAWAATSNNPNITVTPSGTSGGNLTYSINSNWLRDTAVNYQDYVAAITLSVPGNPAITPVAFQIFAQPRLGTVTGVGPRRVLAGQAAQLVVMGRGFADLANPAARLSISGGVTINSVQRVHDGKLLVNVQGMSSGTHDVSINNALGKTPTVESFRVFTPTPPAYATAVTGDYQTTLIVDDERGALFTLDSHHVLKRFTSSGGVWTSTTAPVTNVTNAGLMNDGKLLVTTSADTSSPQAPATIRILDGASFSEISQVAVSTGIQAQNWTVPGLPVGADNKVWMDLAGNCGGPYGTLGYYDPRDAAVHEVRLNDFPCNFRFVPEFAMSRNGERLVMWPHSGVPGGLPPLQYMDVSDQQLHSGLSSPVIGSWDNSAFASEDGSRLVIDQSRVLDAQHEFVGRLQVPYYGSMGALFPDAEEAAAIVSPDGNRVYVLAFNGPDIDQSPGIQMKPRIYVFNSSAAVAANTVLPVLGYFELDDYPSCYNAIGCDRTPATGISMDGKTLFFAGSQRLVIAPIPSENHLTPAAVIGGGASAQGIHTQPWLGAGSAR